MSGGLMSAGRMSGGRLSGGLKSDDPEKYITAARNTMLSASHA